MVIIKDVIIEMLKKILKIVLIGLAIIFIIVAAFKEIKIKDAESLYKDLNAKIIDTNKLMASPRYAEVQTNIYTDTNNVTQNNEGEIHISEDGNLNIDLDAMLQEKIQKLEERNILNKYIKEEKRDEYLMAFIKAEFVTQYPDLRSVDEIGTDTENNEFQGCIQIHRALSDGTTQILSYIPKNQFESYISNNDMTATNHFSLDSEGNLIVAGWTRETTNITSNVPEVENVENRIQYTLTANSINYKSLVEVYTMPFDFLWTLTVMGEDADFVYKVAQLALDSEIIFTVQDNISTSVTKNIEEYQVQEKQKKSAWLHLIQKDSKLSKPVEKTKTSTPVPYKTETTIKTETCSANIDMTYADTWIVKYENSYSNTVPNPIPGTPDITKIDDTDYEVVSETTLKTDAEIEQKMLEFKIEKYGSEEEYKKEEEAGNVSAKISTIYYTKYARVLNKKITTSTSISSNRYVRGTPTVVEKTDRISLEDNFVKLFADSGRAKSNILSISEWLFEAMEKSPQAADMIDLTKYLFYKTTGTDYGVVDFEFKITNLNSFNSIKGSSTENYIKAWENAQLWKYETNQSTKLPAKYLTEDGKYYIVYEDSSRGHNNIAYGWATFINKSNGEVNHPIYGQGYYNWKKQFAAEGIRVEELYEGALVDKQTATAVFQNEILPTFVNHVNNYLKDYLPEYKFSQEQKDALVSIAYQYGNIHGFAEAYKNSLNEDGSLNAEKIKVNFVLNKGSKVFNYTGAVNDRKYANWLLFTQGKYIDRSGEEIKLVTSLVQSAYMVADHFLNSGVDVHYAGKSVPRVTNNGRVCIWGNIQNSWDKPIEQPDRYGVVCATFVSLSMWQAGLVDEATFNKYNYNSCAGLKKFLNNSKYSEQWEKITNWNELQDGDVVFVKGHVFLYVEDGKCLDQAYCVIRSSGKDARRKLTKASQYKGTFECAYRYTGN